MEKGTSKAVEEHKDRGTGDRVKVSFGGAALEGTGRLGILAVLAILVVAALLLAVGVDLRSTH